MSARIVTLEDRVQSLEAWRLQHSAWHYNVITRDPLRLLIMCRNPRVEDELLSLTPKPPGTVSKEIQTLFQRHRRAVNRGVHEWTLAGLLAVLEFQHDSLIRPWIRASNPGIVTVSHQEVVKLLLNVDWDVAHQILGAGDIALETVEAIEARFNLVLSWELDPSLFHQPLNIISTDFLHSGDDDAYLFIPSDTSSSDSLEDVFAKFIQQQLHVLRQLREHVTTRTDDEILACRLCLARGSQYMQGLLHRFANHHKQPLKPVFSKHRQPPTTASGSSAAITDLKHGTKTGIKRVNDVVFLLCVLFPATMIPITHRASIYTL
ncbi:MAG: hypothetical protein Q9187_002778 [Circinaria calcarea]